MAFVTHNDVDSILKVNRFIEEYKDYISKNTAAILMLGLERDLGFDFLTQVYSYLNIIPENENQYLAYFNYLKTHFDLSKNIVEVGTGEFPVLSTYIDAYQRKIGKGTITIFDPNVILDKLGNIIIKKEMFTRQTNLSGADLLIGYKPCEATLPMIDYHNEEHPIPFSFVKCPCNHLPESEKEKYADIPTYLQWSAYVKNYLKEHTNEKALIYYDYFTYGDSKRTVINKTYTYKLKYVQKTRK